MNEHTFQAPSELFHYTTAVGLSGIIESGCIWATHYGYVNDYAEFKSYLENRLELDLMGAIAQALNFFSITNPDFESALELKGGKKLV
jgi:hypothetical protein